MVERQRKNDSDCEQNGENDSVTQIGYQQTSKVDDENEDFGGDDVSHDRADEEALLTFEDDPARRTDVLEIERPRDD